MSQAITVQGLSFQIGGHKILKQVDLTVGVGESVGLIGPNGSGKTSLLKCIYRVNPYHEGRIHLFDRPLHEMSYAESAQRMAVVAQQNELHFDLTVLEMVLLGRSPYKKFLQGDSLADYEVARRAIGQAGLTGLETRTLAALSGGERQRVLLARALCQEPELMILDEPTNHLDIRYRLELMRILRDLNYTMLTAIHDLNLCFAFCDRLYALKDGEVIASGSTAEVLTPALIRELYQVEARILVDAETGQKALCYLA